MSGDIDNKGTIRVINSFGFVEKKLLTDEKAVKKM